MTHCDIRPHGRSLVVLRNGHMGAELYMLAAEGRGSGRV